MLWEFRIFGRDSLWEGIVWFGATQPPQSRSEQTAELIISASRGGLLLPALDFESWEGAFKIPNPDLVPWKEVTGRGDPCKLVFSGLNTLPRHSS